MTSSTIIDTKTTTTQALWRNSTTKASTTTTTSPSDPLVPLKDVFLSPMMLAVYGLFGGILFLSAIAPLLSGRKGKLADGRFATRQEIDNAWKKARKQIQDPIKNGVALYMGSPDSPHSIPICNADTGVLAYGATGRGKSYGAIEQLLRSAIEQGFSLIVYDPAGDHIKNQGAYAASLGYKVYNFEPGSEYSDTLNLEDFIETPSDNEMSGQVGELIQSGAAQSFGKQDGFFGPGGMKTLKACLMHAKASPYPDLYQAFSFLKLPDLPARINTGGQNVWADNAGIILNKTKGASKTSAGLEANAINVLEQLASERNLAVTMGNSTMPIDFQGKQIVFIRYNEQFEAVSAPIVASVISLLVQRNVGNHIQRERPLGLFLDEIASGSLYFKNLASWGSRFRKYRFFCVAGLQYFGQLREIYGNDKAGTIAAAYLNRIYFNPNDVATSKVISEQLGEVEIDNESTSLSRGRGGATRSTSSTPRVRPLVKPEEIERMPQGSCIIVSPGFESKGESSIPLKLKRIKVPKRDRKIQKECNEKWPTLRENMIARRRRHIRWSESSLKVAMRKRDEMADLLLPSPVKQAVKKIMDSPQKETKRQSLIEQAASFKVKRLPR